MLVDPRYLDTTWKVKTGRRLFVNLQAESCARLAQPCASQEEFNSAMSALTDVLSCVVPHSAQAPPRSGALVELKRDLPPGLPTEAEERIKNAIETLLTVNRIRHGQQHGDAKQKAVGQPAAALVGQQHRRYSLRDWHLLVAQWLRDHGDTGSHEVLRAQRHRGSRLATTCRKPKPTRPVTVQRSGSGSSGRPCSLLVRSASLVRGGTPLHAAAQKSGCTCTGRYKLISRAPI